MKKLYFVCICILLIGKASPAIADLDGIQILSEQYHVSGEIYPFGNGDSYSLDSTNSSGISDSIGDGGYFNSASSSAGQFFASADSGLDYGRSIATASVSFQPMTSGWLHADDRVESDWNGFYSHAYLYDSTAGVPLLDVWDVEWTGRGGHSDWLVYDTHEYQLSLSAYSYQRASAFASVNLSFTPIPEPATLFLLTFGGLFLRKRKA
jgi:hypothetical protein